MKNKKTVDFDKVYTEKELKQLESYLHRRMALSMKADQDKMKKIEWVQTPLDFGVLEGEDLQRETQRRNKAIINAGFGKVATIREKNIPALQALGLVQHEQVFRAFLRYHGVDEIYYIDWVHDENEPQGQNYTLHFWVDNYTKHASILKEQDFLDCFKRYRKMMFEKLHIESLQPPQEDTEEKKEHTENPTALDSFFLGAALHTAHLPE